MSAPEPRAGAGLRARLPARRTTRLLAGLLALAVLAGLVVGGVVLVRHLTTSPQERYCAEVTARRTALTEDLSRGAGVGLIAALPILEDLRDVAPEDISGDWVQLVRAVGGLGDALDAAGVDPATYDRDDPPAGVSQAQRAAIDDAAKIVGSLQTRNALLGIDQHSRDVCGTPLTQ